MLLALLRNVNPATCPTIRVSDWSVKAFLCRLDRILRPAIIPGTSLSPYTLWGIYTGRGGIGPERNIRTMPSSDLLDRTVFPRDSLTPKLKGMVRFGANDKDEDVPKPSDDNGSPVPTEHARVEAPLQNPWDLISLAEHEEEIRQQRAEREGSSAVDVRLGNLPDTGGGFSPDTP